MDVRGSVGALIERGFTTRRPTGVVWDPACYRGDIARTLSDARDLNGKEYCVLATDTRSRWDGCQDEREFLLIRPDDINPLIEAIVSYPPSGGRSEFVRHALDLMKDHKGAVLLLMPITMHGSAHRDLFEWPYAGMFILRGTDHAWFCWDWRRDRSRPVREVLAPVAMVPA